MANDYSKKPIGTMPCEGQNCDSHGMTPPIPVSVMENAKGTLSYFCPYCRRAPHARPSTGQYDDWKANLKPHASAKPPAEPKPADPKPKDPAPADPPKPPVKKSTLGNYLL